MGNWPCCRPRPPPNNPLGLCLGGLPDLLPTALRAEGNPKSEVRRPPRPAFDIAICHLQASGSVYSPRRGARYEPGTRHARDSTKLNRNSIKPSAVSYLSMHWLLQGLADAAAGLPNVCIFLRPAFLSRDPPCPVSNQTLPSCDLDPEVPRPSVLALAHSIQPVPHRIPSVAPPETHRRFSFNLRCVSGGVTERIGRGASWSVQKPPEQTE